MTKDRITKLYAHFLKVAKEGKNEAIRRNAKLHAEQTLEGHPYLAIKAKPIVAAGAK